MYILDIQWMFKDQAKRENLILFHVLVLLYLTPSVGCSAMLAKLHLACRIVHGDPNAPCCSQLGFALIFFLLLFTVVFIFHF